MGVFYFGDFAVADVGVLYGVAPGKDVFFGQL